MKLTLDRYFISDDSELLSFATIHRYLSQESYWAQGRSEKTIERAISNSLCYGVYTEKNELVGFARVITDYATAYYVCDLFILSEHRKQGLGKRLMEFIIKHPALQGLTGLLLTKDAHGLYRQYGFSDDADVQSRFMLKKREPGNSQSGPWE